MYVHEMETGKVAIRFTVYLYLVQVLLLLLVLLQVVHYKDYKKYTNTTTIQYCGVLLVLYSTRVQYIINNVATYVRSTVLYCNDADIGGTNIVLSPTLYSLLLYS
jgi:hypothetical protein